MVESGSAAGSWLAGGYSGNIDQGPFATLFSGCDSRFQCLLRRHSESDFLPAAGVVAVGSHVAGAAERQLQAAMDQSDAP